MFAAIAASGAAAAEEAAAGDAGQALRMVRLEVRDPQINNDVAFDMLVAKGWTSEGGILWRHDCSELASVAMKLVSPDGTCSIEVFPNQMFTWTEGGMPFFPQGSNYMGNEVQPPLLDMRQFVQQVILPRFRGAVAGQARIAKIERLDDVAKTILANIQEQGIVKEAQAARVRVEYDEGDRPVEEDIYCVLLHSTAPAMPGWHLWSTERVYGFRAPRGQLDAQTPLMQAMVQSVRLNLGWYNKVMQVYAIRNQGIQQSIEDAGRLSRHISQVNDEILEMNRQAYENQQASQDRVARQFDNYIRGVEEYQNPIEEKAVQLPSGYNQAWVSGSGEYILSNDPGFNPNENSTIEWREMPKGE